MFRRAYNTRNHWVFNEVQFQTPSGNVNSSVFGLVTNANDPRIGQLALKLVF
jgi:hypothetical protein